MDVDSRGVSLDMLRFRDVSTFEVRFLEPSQIKLFRTPGSSQIRMTIEDERSVLRVHVVRCFPLSDPHHFLSLRDGADQEIGILKSLHGLDPESRRIIEEELDRRYFVPAVQKVYSVREEYGTITWDVQTNRGRRVYQVRHLRDNVQEVTPTRLIITDMDGNRFEIPDTTKLDSRSMAVIARAL
ncbi:MAG: DUF1854 domain-containing protein [Armatimonadota bacterium]